MEVVDPHSIPNEVNQRLILLCSAAAAPHNPTREQTKYYIAEWLSEPFFLATELLSQPGVSQSNFG